VVEGIIRSGLDLELFAGSEIVSYATLGMSIPGFLQNPRFDLRSTSIVLCPPDEQEILHYLVFQPSFPSRIL
jgi:hypothetical protein